MLPIATDNGARLAAILPSGMAAMLKGRGGDPADAWGTALPPGLGEEGRSSFAGLETLPAVRSFVLVVVDGLGSANLKAVLGHAPALRGLGSKRIETVYPSTTGAALTTLTTGELPGVHGLVGYRIRHPELGLVTTLRDWGGIDRPEKWQRAEPLFRRAGRLGFRPVAIGRPAHAEGGLTEAILDGAEYHPGQRIEDRFAIASRLVRSDEPVLAYLYVDELDRAAHKFGWQSPEWLHRLEQLDTALEGLLRSLPSGVGVALTADHGIVDVAPHQQIMLDERPELVETVEEIGGEPRMRSLYLREGADPGEVAAQWRDAEDGRAWVGTREEAISAGWFGPVDPEIASRLGDVIIAARKQVAYYSGHDSPQSLAMIGQHGSLSAEERGVPLALAGALAGSSFVSAVTRAARDRLPVAPEKDPGRSVPRVG